MAEKDCVILAEKVDMLLPTSFVNRFMRITVPKSAITTYWPSGDASIHLRLQNTVLGGSPFITVFS